MCLSSADLMHTLSCSFAYQFYYLCICPSACPVALAAGRRSGVVVVNVVKIRTPLVRKGTELYLEMGDQLYEQLSSLVRKGKANGPRK